MQLLAELRDDPELGRRPLVVVCSASQDQTLAGEWRVRADVDAEALAGTLGAAIVAERSSILVVGRSAVRDRVEAELLATGLDHQWATTGTAAAQACRAERFEVALVDAGMRAVDDVLECAGPARRPPGQGGDRVHRRRYARSGFRTQPSFGPTCRSKRPRRRWWRRSADAPAGTLEPG